MNYQMILYKYSISPGSEKRVEALKLIRLSALTDQLHFANNYRLSLETARVKSLLGKVYLDHGDPGSAEGLYLDSLKHLSYCFVNIKYVERHVVFSAFNEPGSLARKYFLDIFEQKSLALLSLAHVYDRLGDSARCLSSISLAQGCSQYLGLDGSSSRSDELI